MESQCRDYDSSERTEGQRAIRDRVSIAALQVAKSSQRGEWSRSTDRNRAKTDPQPYLRDDVTRCDRRNDERERHQKRPEPRRERRRASPRRQPFERERAD